MVEKEIVGPSTEFFVNCPVNQKRASTWKRYQRAFRSIDSEVVPSPGIRTVHVPRGGTEARCSMYPLLTIVSPLPRVGCRNAYRQIDPVLKTAKTVCIEPHILIAEE